MLLKSKKKEDVAEKRRLLKMTSYEREALGLGYSMIAGIDEAGRGPLAGPVVAAAAIIKPGHLIPYVDDSKKLLAPLRERLFDQITADPDIEYAVGIVDHEEIDRINIYQATKQAMNKAFFGLKNKPDFLLIDAMKLESIDIPQKNIIRGDSLSHTIAVASIIAKVTRDKIMVHFDEQYPNYGFASHKGYTTKRHLEALEKYGPCPIHRRSFAPVKNPLCDTFFEIMS